MEIKMTPKELREKALRVKTFNEEMVALFEKVPDTEIDKMVKNNHPCTRVHMQILRQWGGVYKTSEMREKMIAECKHIALFPEEFALEFYADVDFSAVCQP